MASVSYLHANFDACVLSFAMSLACRFERINNQIGAMPARQMQHIFGGMPGTVLNDVLSAEVIILSRV